MNDLEKNDDTGLLRLADKRRFGHADLVAQVEALERDIVEYFKSRNEDKQANTNPIQRPKPVPTKPFVPAKTQDHRRAGPRGGGGGASKPSRLLPSRFPGGTHQTHLWTSGHAGTHVDDDYPYGHPDDQYCPDPDDDHHHHCDDNDDHHHHHDHHNDHHDHHHHDDYSYGGAGSFY